MEDRTQTAGQKLLEAAISDAVSGKTGYEDLMDAFGRAKAEHTEVLAVRSPREKLQADGSPQVEFLEVPAGSNQVWLCVTSREHLQAMTGGKGTIRTAVLTLGTLLAMAEDAGIGGIVFNPDLQPNLTISAAGLREIPTRAERYLEQCRQEKLRAAGSRQRPGWIL